MNKESCHNPLFLSKDTAPCISDSMLHDGSLDLDAFSDDQDDSSNTDRDTQRERETERETERERQRETETETDTETDTDTDTDTDSEVQEDRSLDEIENDGSTLPDASIIPENVDGAAEDVDEDDTTDVLFSLDKGQTFSSWNQADQ